LLQLGIITQLYSVILFITVNELKWFQTSVTIVSVKF